MIADLAGYSYPSDPGLNVDEYLELIRGAKEAYFMSLNVPEEGDDYHVFLPN